MYWTYWPKGISKAGEVEGNVGWTLNGLVQTEATATVISYPTLWLSLKIVVTVKV